MTRIAIVFAIATLQCASGVAQGGKNRETAGKNKETLAKLEAAVNNAKRVLKNAEEKLAAFKKSAYTKGGKGDKFTKGGKGKGSSQTNYYEIYAKLQAAVKAGKLTPKEAAATMAALKKTAQLKGGKGDKFTKGDKGKGGKYTKGGKGKGTADANLKKAWADLQAAVKAGKLTKKEAYARMSALKKAAQYKSGKGDKGKGGKGDKPTKGGKDKGGKGANLKAVWAKLLALVKAGKLTQKEAEAKMAAIKKAAEK